MSEIKNYYEKYWINFWREKLRIDSRLYKEILSFIKSHSVVLDIGCGDGSHYSMLFSGEVKKYIGVDISFEALKKFKRGGTTIPVLCNIETTLPLKYECFDLVLWIEVAEHLLFPEFTLKEIHRVLKKDGILIITVPNIVHFWNRILFLFGYFNPMGSPKTSIKTPYKDPHIRFFTVKSLKNMLIQNGFKVIKIKGFRNRLLYTMPLIGKWFKWDFIFYPFWDLLTFLFPSIFASRIFAVAVKI